VGQDEGVGAANVSTNLGQADFLTPAEFHRGPDLLRPGTLTGKQVDPAAIAFTYTQHPYEGDDPDIRVSPEDRRFISWPAAMGHEQRPPPGPPGSPPELPPEKEEIVVTQGRLAEEIAQDILERYDEINPGCQA
jgi:hypothetical protein